MVAHKKNFYDIVAKPTTVRSQSGYVNDINANVWELRGRPLNFEMLADAVTEGFLEETKRQFATVLNAQGYADRTHVVLFRALKDCVHFAFRRTRQKVNTLTSAMIEEWRDEASAVHYPYFLKLFITAVRARSSSAFPNVTSKVLRTLTQPDADVLNVLTLDPKQGPWLEREVLDQDRAIEHAYTSGAWHVERTTIVQGESW